MARTALLLAAAGATFALEPFIARLGVVGSAAGMICIAILLALAASGSLTALGAAGGAVGAFAHGALAGVSPAVAGAALVGICFAERTLRVRGPAQRLVHIGTAIVAGAIAGALASAYMGSPFAVRAVVVVISAVLVALPLMVDADDPLAHSLDWLSREVSDPARRALRAGADLRREVDDDVLDASTQKEMRATWRTLHQLAQARVKLEQKHGAALKGKVQTKGRRAAQAVVNKLDQRIEEHVDVLTQAYTALDAASAAELSMNDSALDVTKTTGESLEEVSNQLLGDDTPAPVRVSEELSDNDQSGGEQAKPAKTEVPELELS